MHWNIRSAQNLREGREQQRGHARPPELSDRIASMSATPLGLVRSSGLTLKPSTLCQSEGTEQSLGLVRLVSFLLGMIPGEG